MNLTCPKCNGHNQLEIPDTFAQCQFCRSALFIDIDKVAVVYSFTPTIQSDQLSQYLKRDFEKMGFNEAISIRDSHPVFIPFWQVGESMELQRASSHFQEMKTTMPTGSKIFFNHRESLEKHIETFSIDTQPAVDTERTLYYIPFFQVSIVYDEKTYKFLVNAVNGTVSGEAIPYISSEKTFRLFPLFISVFLTMVVIYAVFSDMLIGIPLSFLCLYLLYNASLRKLAERYNQS